MELKEPEKQILDDFEHKVTGKIDKYGDEPDFPKLENYGITRMDLDNYLLISRRFWIWVAPSVPSSLWVVSSPWFLYWYCHVSLISRLSMRMARRLPPSLPSSSACCWLALPSRFSRWLSFPCQQVQGGKDGNLHQGCTLLRAESIAL